MTNLKARLFAALLVAVACGAPTLADTAASEPLVGDPERGKIVYQRVGICVNCHGWAGDGKTGRNPRAPDAGASLRETELDAETLVTIVRCGLPGTMMPFHEGAAYRDDRCYGMTADQFEAGEAPARGETFRPDDARNVVAYIQAHMIGLGDPNFEECAHYFEGSADKACAYLRAED